MQPQYFRLAIKLGFKIHLLIWKMIAYIKANGLQEVEPYSYRAGEGSKPSCQFFL